jgi:hypothetical protein
VYTSSEKIVIAFVRIHFQQFESQEYYYNICMSKVSSLNPLWSFYTSAEKLWPKQLTCIWWIWGSHTFLFQTTLSKMAKSIATTKHYTRPPLALTHAHHELLVAASTSSQLVQSGVLEKWLSLARKLGTRQR